MSSSATQAALTEGASEQKTPQPASARSARARAPKQPAAQADDGQSRLSVGRRVVQENEQLTDLELMQTRRARADEIRKAMNYTGRMTGRLLAELEWLLDEPTPDEYRVQRENGTETIDVLYQQRYLDDVLGRAHWRHLIHYEDGGTTARVYVVVGNKLGADNVFIDERTGQLINRGEAEILACRDGAGGLSESETKGTLLMGTETAVLKRVIGRGFGPGRDVLAEQAASRGSSPNRQPGQKVVPLRRPDLHGVGGIGDRKAADVQIKLLRGIVHKRNLPASTVARAIRKAAKAPIPHYASEQEAQAYVDEMLSDRKIVLAAWMVPPLTRELEQIEVPEQPEAAREGAASEGVAYEPGHAGAA